MEKACVYDYQQEEANGPEIDENPIQRQESGGGCQLLNLQGESKIAPWKQNLIWARNMRFAICPTHNLAPKGSKLTVTMRV